MRNYWRIEKDGERKSLVFDQRIPAPFPAYRPTVIPEQDVAQLILFLQTCGETWKCQTTSGSAASPAM